MASKTVSKQDITAAVGIIGAIVAQVQAGFHTLHDLIPTLAGAGVVALHQLTAFAKEEETSLSADVQAQLTKMRGDVNETVHSANSSIASFGANLTAARSELDSLRQTVSKITAAPPATPVTPVPTTPIPPIGG